MRGSWVMAVMAAACGHAGVVVALSGVGQSGSVGEPQIVRGERELGLVEVAERAPMVEARSAPAAVVEVERVAVHEADRAAAERGAAAVRMWEQVMRVWGIERVRADGAFEEMAGAAAVVREGMGSVTSAMASVREFETRAARAGEVMRQRRAAASAARGEGVAATGRPGDIAAIGASEGGGAGGTVGNGPQRTGGVARGPVAAQGNRAPAYPSEAKRVGVEGRVEVGVRVSAAGLVALAWIVRGSGASTLDASALEAVRAWRFAPALDEGGAAVECEVVVPVEFRLKKR